jgi:hypothetical protein
VKCSSVKCAAEARCVIQWPGAPASPKCVECTQKAMGVAEALGFMLPFDTEPEWLAKKARAAEFKRLVLDAARRLSEPTSEDRP